MSLSLLFNSLVVGVVATLLALGAGLAVALATAASARGPGAWLTLTVANLAVPPFLATNAWLDLTGSWRALAAPAVVDQLSLLLTALVLASVLWPLTTLLALGAWSKLQPELLEADPRWRGWRLFRWLLVPAARGELAAAAAITFVLALANFTVPTLFQVRVFTEEFWIRFNTQFDTAGALRAAWPLMVFPCLLLLALRRKPVRWPRLQSPLPPVLLRRQLGPLAMVAVACSVVWLAVTLGLPLGRLLLTTRTWTELPGAVLAGRGALLNSFATAAITATVVVAVGLLRGGFAGQPRHPRVSWLVFFVPGVFLGVLLIAVFNRPALSAIYQSLAIELVALTLRYLAPGGALVAYALGSMDTRLVEAAASLGAGRWRVWRDTVMPQVFPGVAAAWYAVYLLCLWDVETVVLIQPPGGETLALRIFNLLHYGHAAQVNALCVVMLGLAVAPFAAGLLFRRLVAAQMTNGE